MNCILIAKENTKINLFNILGIVQELNKMPLSPNGPVLAEVGLDGDHSG